MKFKVEIKESKTEDLTDKELMSLYKKYKKQNKNKEAEALIDEIDKRGLKESYFNNNNLDLFINAIIDNKNKFIGFYIADDEEPTLDPHKALTFKTKQSAEKDAKEVIQVWDIKKIDSIPLSDYTKYLSKIK